MARETSIVAYHKIKNEGLLSLRRWQVYDFVFQRGPCTAREAVKQIVKQGFSTGSITTRFAELRELGVICEVGTKLDAETKQTVILWEVTNKLPVKTKPVKKEKCPHCGSIK